MSIHSKSSTAIKIKKEEEQPHLEEIGTEAAQIIPWPDLKKIAVAKPRKKKEVRLDSKYLYCRGRKIPILQFQKSGYDKLLKLLVKEIG